MRSGSKSARGFTLVELLVVVAIIGILASLMFPIFASAREKARQAACMNNQRQLGVAITIYASDHERYPGDDWLQAINMPTGVKRCPSSPENQDLGYGMNSYMFRLKQDVIARPSSTIMICDAAGSSTVSADLDRHAKGAIFARADGSVVYARKTEDAGRYACGRFPIIPIEIVDGQPTMSPPQSFTEYSGSPCPSWEYAVAGPYGDGLGDGTASGGSAVMANQIMVDYIGENVVARSTADVSPIPNDVAPNQKNIAAPSAADQADRFVNTLPINQFSKWTRLPQRSTGTLVNYARMELEKNYNTSFVFRTTYAVLYVYAENPTPATIDWYSDDGGIIWMNGTFIARDPTKSPGTSPFSPAPSLTIPKGISYFLIKCTNSEEGGMKFKLVFNTGGVPLAFSPTI